MKICLYSPVQSKEIFSRVGFYRDDISALSYYGDECRATNSLGELFNCRPALIVGYFYSKSLFAALIGKLIGAKVILTGGADEISSGVHSGSRLLFRKLIAFLCLVVADKIFVSCTDDFRNFKKLSLGINFLKNKIKFVSHVVVPAPTCVKRNNYEGEEFKALTICWMGAVGNVYRKGVDKSIRLIADLKNIGIKATLKIAGTDGPGRMALEQIAIELEVRENIYFLGPVSDEEKNKLFMSESVYLQLSSYEGFGVAAAEAFFSGMVVIHTNKGGLADVIGHRGLVVDYEKGQHHLHDIKKFYEDFRGYNIDINFLKESLIKYSIQARANSFLR